MAIDIKTLALALTMAAGALGCAAHQPEAEPAPVPASSSVQQADARLAETAQGRASVEARFAEREQICYAKFFVNHCLDQAKEERRAALSGLRAIEIEANRFKRAHAVEQRDLALAADNAKAQPPVPRPVKEKAQPAAAPQARAARQPRPVAVTDDVRRAANVAAYEKKRSAAQQRQREIAAKQLEKERAAARDAARKAAPATPGAGVP
jgi:hypothetical protein